MHDNGGHPREIPEMARYTVAAMRPKVLKPCLDRIDQLQKRSYS